MATRYQQLRMAIARLAATADEQNAYLDSILRHLTPAGDATGYGNDELALEFGNIYLAVVEMEHWGEITHEEIAAAKPLDALLDRWSGEANADFWEREALWIDPRWEQVRQCAREVLSQYPDEDRPSDWLKATGA
jgi:hypothetical protein